MKTVNKLLGYFNPRSPCGERPTARRFMTPARTNFNPRSPCGERRGDFSPPPKTVEFQSTLPVRGATVSSVVLLSSVVLFQSTLPVRGATTAMRFWCGLPVFQSTLPVRGATAGGGHCSTRSKISIHAPRAGSDRENSDHYPDFQIILVWLFVSGRIWLLILNISQSI